MTVTREQVADLQPGDVVEMSGGSLHDAVVRGPVYQRNGWLLLGPDQVVRTPEGDPTGDRGRTLAVISRAPRPLYVNHDRTEPVPGDVVRDADAPSSATTYDRCVDGVGIHAWRTTGGVTWLVGDRLANLPARLRLLVDGATGQVVP